MTQRTLVLGKDQYIAAVESNSAQLAEAARRGLGKSVPTCPGWFVATLVAHIGEVQRFWAHQIKARAQAPVELPSSEYDSCPGLLAWYTSALKGKPDLAAIPDGLITWFEAATRDLVAAFRAVDSVEAVWHWSGDHRALAHFRNQAMEATVHRWDAQNAVGHTTSIDPVIARDGIDQHFDVQITAARKRGKSVLGTGEAYAFTTTDVEGHWLVRFEGDTFTVAGERGDADITIAGRTEDVFLWLWGRIAADRLQVQGDPALLQRYRELVSASN